MATISGSSVRRLQESFRQWVGCTPMQYLADVRLLRAHIDLQSHPTRIVAVVAARWGFSSPSRFATAYAADTGRRRQKGGPGSASAEFPYRNRVEGPTRIAQLSVVRARSAAMNCESCSRRRPLRPRQPHRRRPQRHPRRRPRRPPDPLHHHHRPEDPGPARRRLDQQTSQLRSSCRRTRGSGRLTHSGLNHLDKFRTALIRDWRALLRDVDVGPGVRCALAIGVAPGADDGAVAAQTEGEQILPLPQQRSSSRRRRTGPGCCHRPREHVLRP